MELNRCPVVLRASRASVSFFIALCTFVAGVSTSPLSAYASVQLISIGIVPDQDVQPVPMLTPPAVPVSLAGFVRPDGEENPLPAIPAAAEYDKLIRAQRDVGALGVDLLGESVDYYTGETDFVATDVSLSGSNALEVAVGRRYHVANHAGGVLQGAFGDWDIEIPHVEGVVATSVGWTVPVDDDMERCTYFGPPPAASTTTNTSSGPVTSSVSAAEYSLGYTVVIPGKGRHELLLRNSGTPAPGGAHPVTTKELWAVSCAQREGGDPGGPDEGFVITTPDGVTYRFTQGMLRPYSPLNRPADTNQSGVTATVDREQVWLLPSVVTDRFGNTVTYTYTGAAENLRLSAINASDGRSIGIGYDGLGRITSLTDGTRTWGYGYSNVGWLTSVSLPGGSGWGIDFSALNDIDHDYSAATCAALPTTYLLLQYTGSLTGPTGAHGSFTFEVTRTGRAGAPSTCLANSVGTNFARTEPAIYDVLALKTKSLSGGHVSGTQTWSLSYDGCSYTDCGATKTTTVTGPYSNTKYTFGAQYGTDGSGDEGMLLEKQSGGSGTYPQDEHFTYDTAAGHPYPSVSGVPAQVRGDVSQLSSLRPLYTHTLSRDGANYSTTWGSPDSYGYPQSITHQGSNSRTDSIGYDHNTSAWILGTVYSISSGGTTEVEFTLNGAEQPTQVKRFSRVTAKYGYNGNGTMQWSEDGAGNHTGYSNYKLGIPQRIDHPTGGGFETVGVSTIGRITSHTNVMGHATGYNYDGMGRLSEIDPPSPYLKTTIGWTYSPTAGYWSRQIKTGNATTTDAYDIFMHSVETDDSASRTVTRGYDTDGNMTFQSYPGSTTAGTSYGYDGFHRMTSMTDYLGHSAGVIYGANETSATDRNGHGVETHYLAYDAPSTAWPITIYSGTGAAVVTQIVRDPWGVSDSVTRGGIHRTLTRNTAQQLWKLIEPETGTTVFTYDNAGNVQTIDHNGATTETRTYDTMNRLLTTSFGDSTQGATYTWRADGQPDTATHSGTTRTYHYDNTADLLSSETISIGGTNYTVGYDYDTSQHLKTLTYPDTTTVDYSPDDFGRPGKVGTYATNLTYYANDAVHQFTYGNTIAHTMVQDDRTLPKTVTDAGVLAITATYDNNGNPLTYADSGHPANARTLTYDDRDRLHTAQGPWGSSTFTYDDQDNLKGETGSWGATLVIDGMSNQATSVTAGGATRALTWDTRGRLSQKGSGTTATTYTFDGADLLVALMQPAGRSTYTYDALGYRATAISPTDAIATVYDYAGRLLYATDAPVTNPDRIFADGFEISTVQNTATKYVYLGSHLLAKVDKTGSNPAQTTYVHTDPLGTPVAQTNAAHALVGTSTYYAYGALAASTGIGDEAGPAYANQYADPSGLIYMRARYYDPQLRRFISSDPNPISPGAALGFNRYGYASNSPYANYDPSGREAACITAQTECVNEAGVVQDLQTISQNADAVTTAIMASTPIGAEIGVAEKATVAAAEEVVAVAPAVIDDVGQIASAAGEAMVRVGRWMSDAERDAMTATGLVQESSSLEGITSVSMPPNPAAWIRQTAAPNYVEFDAAASAVRPLGNVNAKIYGPSSIFGPKLGITEMPSATNILQTVCRIPMNCSK